VACADSIAHLPRKSTDPGGLSANVRPREANSNACKAAGD